MGGTRSSATSTGGGVVAAPSILPTEPSEGRNGTTVSWYWSGGPRPSDEELRERVDLFNEVAANVPPEALDGLHRISFAEDNLWIGSVYYPPNKDRRMVQDEIAIAMEQVRRRGPRVVYEEIGHRMQNVSHKSLYQRFKQRDLGKHAEAIDLPKKQLDMRYERMREDGLTRKEIAAGEVFAKSFSYYKVGLPLPDEVRKFWEEAGV